MQQSLCYSVFTPRSVEKVPIVWMGEHSRTYSGGDKVKINRTFSIEMGLYEELRKRSNQSATVCAALRGWFFDHHEIVSEMSTRRLMAILNNRKDVSRNVKLACIRELNAGTSDRLTSHKQQEELSSEEL